MTTERLEEIVKGTAYPESRSVYQAIFQVENEVRQEFNSRTCENCKLGVAYDGAEQNLSEFIYLEDNQMYYTVPFVFKTDAPYSIREFEKISYSAPGAGRMSTSFGKFKKLIQERGYTIELVEELPQGDAPKGYKVIKGATGNY